MKMNKGLKRMLPIAVGAMIMISGVTPAFAVEKVETSGANFTFQEFIQKEYANEFKNVNNEDMKSLEKLYNEATALEKNEKYDESYKKWDAFDKIFDKYVDEDRNCSKIEESIDGNYEPETFKEFMEYFKDANISGADMKSLEKLYNEIAELEKNEKYDESNKKWDAFDKILDKYVDASTFDESGLEDIDDNFTSDDLEKQNGVYKNDDTKTYDDAYKNDCKK